MRSAAQSPISLRRLASAGFVQCFTAYLIAFIGGPASAQSPSTPASAQSPSTVVQSMTTARQQHTATRLLTGQVLIVGGEDQTGHPTASVELYNPTTKMWSPAAPIPGARYAHTANLLANGKVLIAGGFNGKGAVTPSAEVYDPNSNSWSPAVTLTSALTPRWAHTATTLADGRVLVLGGVGGIGSSAALSLEIYDSNNNHNPWFNTGIAASIAGHTATLMGNGQVLVYGGETSNSVEVYDPSAGQWHVLPPYGPVRYLHTGTLLNNGQILISGGWENQCSNPCATPSTLTYDPTSGWQGTQSLPEGRTEHIAILLKNGQVAVIGGTGSATAEMQEVQMYNPLNRSWLRGGFISTTRVYHAAALLSDGQTVLIAGGLDQSGATLASAELWGP